MTITEVMGMPLTVAAMVVLTACANPSDGRPSSVTDLPNVAEVVCESDGTTTVITPRIVVQPDGVHMRVVSRLDEPASMNGWGFDLDPGNSTWVFGRRPGSVGTACWPFSDHASGTEPPTQPIEILDPDSTFVSAEVECDQAFSWTADYATAPDDAPPIPLDIAGRLLDGLRPADVVRYSGYPEEEDPGVVVVRDGTVVASVAFARFDGEWSSPGGTICSGSGIRTAGV